MSTLTVKQRTKSYTRPYHRAIDDRLLLRSIGEIYFKTEENIMGIKEKNASYQHFLLFP